MSDTCRRVDDAVAEWERGETSDTQSLFFIINHTRGCARCERAHGALIPLIRRDTGEPSGLEAPVDEPSAGFTERVMRRAAGAKVHSFSSAVLRRAQWVLPLAGSVALLLGIGLVILQARLASASSTVMVHFTLEAPSASRVSLAGDFNQWRPGELNLKRGQNGTWEITVALPRGTISTYDFLIDDGQWVADPHSESRIDDGFGGTSSVLRL